MCGVELGSNGFFVEVSHAIFNYRNGECRWAKKRKQKQKPMCLMCHHKDVSNRYRGERKIKESMSQFYEWGFSSSHGYFVTEAKVN